MSKAGEPCCQCAVCDNACEVHDLLLQLLLCLLCMVWWSSMICLTRRPASLALAQALLLPLQDTPFCQLLCGQLMHGSTSTTNGATRQHKTYMWAAQAMTAIHQHSCDVVCMLHAACTGHHAERHSAGPPCARWGSCPLTQRTGNHQRRAQPCPSFLTPRQLLAGWPCGPPVPSRVPLGSCQRRAALPEQAGPAAVAQPAAPGTPCACRTHSVNACALYSRMCTCKAGPGLHLYGVPGISNLQTGQLASAEGRALPATAEHGMRPLCWWLLGRLTASSLPCYRCRC